MFRLPAFGRVSSLALLALLAVKSAPAATAAPAPGTVVAPAPASASVIAPASAPVIARSSPSTSAPAPTPTPNAEAERDYARAREVWRARTDVPYVRYGALVRYLHGSHVFDTWWDADYRSSDGALALFQLHDVAEERHRLGGVPFSIFGLKIFDTNPDAEPIRLDEPRIDPASSFGILARLGTPAVPHSAASRQPASGASALPDFTVRPTSAPTGELREISRVEANTREYDIQIAGTETVLGVPALHLTLTPLRDPKINRLRDLWLDPSTFRTVQLQVQGLLNGRPYDGVKWKVRYVLVDGRQYVQQIIADEPLKFGLDTTIPKFEFDFVDFHFPAEVPRFTFDRPF